MKEGKYKGRSEEEERKRERMRPRHSHSTLLRARNSSSLPLSPPLIPITHPSPLFPSFLTPVLLVPHRRSPGTSSRVVQGGSYTEGINTRTCGSTVVAGSPGTVSGASTLLCKGSCNKGYIVNVSTLETLSQCTPCAAGRYSSHGTSSSCTICGKDFFSGAAAGSVSTPQSCMCALIFSPLTRGVFRVLSLSLSLSLSHPQHAPPPYPALTPPFPKCTACPVGGYTISEGSIETDCFSVPPGYYLVAETWRRCELGYFCVGGNRSAASPGYYTDREGSVQPEACPRGRYTTSVAASSCTACPLGRFSNSTTSGATSLAEGCSNYCPTGRYGSWTGQFLEAVACQYTCGGFWVWSFSRKGNLVT